MQSSAQADGSDQDASCCALAHGDLQRLLLVALMSTFSLMCHHLMVSPTPKLVEMDAHAKDLRYSIQKLAAA